MLGVKAILFPAAAGVCVLTLVYLTIHTWRAGRHPALTALIIAFGCKSISFLLAAPQGSRAVDEFTGVPNLGALGIYLFAALGFSAAVMAALAHWLLPPPEARRMARRSAYLAGIGTVVLTGLWWNANHGATSRSAHFLLSNLERDPVALLLVVYITFFAAGKVGIAWFSLRCIRKLPTGWLRRGLATALVGTLLYLIYCVNRLIALAVIRFGWDPLDWELLTPLTNSVGAALLAAGLTMPSWGPTASRCRRALRDWRRARLLWPLWADLTSVVPDVVLRTGRPSVLGLMDDADLQLYRRVVEIRDGLMAVGPYLAGVDLADPVAVARALPSALADMREHGEPPAESAGAEPATAHLIDDFHAEVAWLSQLAAAYRATRTPLTKTSRTRSSADRSARTSPSTASRSAS